MMRVVPVIDLKGGIAVQAVGGDRASYQPLRRAAGVSPLSGELKLFEQLNHFNFVKQGTDAPRSPTYVADLDAIAGQPLNQSAYRQIQKISPELWVDAGVRTAADALRLRHLGVTVVAGTETIAGPAAWEAIVRAIDASQLILSLDLFDGRPIVNGDWNSDTAPSLAESALEIAASARADGVRRLIVLDLARVGRKQGPGTELLCERLSRRYPDLELIVGGGVRVPDDFARLHHCGVDTVLSSTALNP